MSRPTQITIDLSALNANLARVRTLAPGCSVMAMVKSNAYGHGLTRIAQALKATDAFGVASLEEGLLLREAGITQPIVLMEGLFFADELAKAAAGNFTLVIHHQEQAAMLEGYKGNNLSAWLKIDTGMHRLGCAPNEISLIYQELMKFAGIKKPIGLMSHFAESDAVNRTKTLQQLELFNSLTKDLSGPRSIANSAGIIAWPSSHLDWVRPGIMLYGASPFAGHTGLEYGLQPVMSLSSKLIAIHSLSKGETVGYGGTWTSPEETRIGVVAIGYGDGYPRHAKNGTPILVNGRPCPLAGRVSMDMLTVDLSTQPEAKVGDPVLLWGPGLPVEIIAEHSGTSCYELLTRITQRVRVVST